MNVLTHEDTVRECMSKMCEGNPGALKAMLVLVQRDQIQGLVDLHHLDDLGIRGPGIHVAYAYHCRYDSEKFHECIISRDPAMIALVKKEGYLKP